MKVGYIRVSALDQNVARQETALKSYIDKCSGAIAFANRPEAMKLLRDIDTITEVQVHSIDRLGRNTLDIMQTIQFFTDKGINVIGAQGGINTQREIVVNFFIERRALPKSQSFLVEGDGLGEEVKDLAEPKDLNESFIRYIQTGVIFNYNTAKVIHEWLGDHIKKLEEINDSNT